MGLSVYTRYVNLEYSIQVLIYFFLATSVNVERVFSHGRLLLSHVHNQLSVESTRALLCLGAWSRLGLVNNEDLLAAAALPDVKTEGLPVTRSL
jgi:hypothetical protein